MSEVLQTGSKPAPELSVILVAPSGMASIGRTMRHLQSQTASRSMEVIIVAPRAADIDVAAIGGNGRFAALRVAEAGAITERGHAAAVGILAATAPIIGLVEDHSFPEPDWAAALIDAHREPWAGVGPVVQNANPATALSWVNFVLTYGTLSPPAIRGARDVIPWHNSAYKRSALEPFAKRLGALLEWEGELQNELIAAGWQLCLEPAARTSHVNVSTGWSTIALGFQRGRLMAAERARHNSWSPVRRLLYALACPALTLVILRDLVPVMRRMELASTTIMRMLPALLLTSMSTALGMGFGYAAGSAGAVERIEDIELNRYRHVTRSDWAVLGITEQPR